VHPTALCAGSSGSGRRLLSAAHIHIRRPPTRDPLSHDVRGISQPAHFHCLAFSMSGGGCSSTRVDFNAKANPSPSPPYLYGVHPFFTVAKLATAPRSHLLRQ